MCLVDTGQPLVSSDWHHCPKRTDYFSEDVDPRYGTQEAAQAAADALNTANPRPWVRYGVGEITDEIPAGDLGGAA